MTAPGLNADAVIEHIELAVAVQGPQQGLGPAPSIRISPSMGACHFWKRLHQSRSVSKQIHTGSSFCMLTPVPATNWRNGSRCPLGVPFTPYTRGTEPRKKQTSHPHGRRWFHVAKDITRLYVCSLLRNKQWLSTAAWFKHIMFQRFGPTMVPALSGHGCVLKQPPPPPTKICSW